MLAVNVAMLFKVNKQTQVPMESDPHQVLNIREIQLKQSWFKHTLFRTINKKSNTVNNEIQDKNESTQASG